MRHERPIGASSQKWKCPDGPFVCLTGTRDQGRLTSDWQLSLIVISSKARNLFHRDQGLTPPHVPRTSPLSSSVFHTACALSAPAGHLPLEEKAAIREYHPLKRRHTTFVNLSAPQVPSSRAQPRDLYCTVAICTHVPSLKRHLGASFFVFPSLTIYRSARRIPPLRSG